MTASSTTSASRRRVTSGTGVGLALAVASVATGATAADAQEYTVVRGDTVSHIALRTSTTVAQIVAANGLDSRARIRAGQRLVIPTAGTPAKSPAASPAPAKPAPATTTHRVVRGDTVSGLAKRYGTTIDAIVAANNLRSASLIRIGETLTIPGTTGTAGTVGTAAAPAKAAAPASSAPATTTHRVVRGDTVSGLAKRYGTTIDAIVAANNLRSASLIRIGETLTIPGTTGTAGTAAQGASTVRNDLVGSTFAGRTYPAATVASANQNKATLLSIGVPSKAEMQALVVATADAMGVDRALAQAVAYQESGFQHDSVSPANAIGTMQVIPTSGQWASDLVGRQLNLLDPRDNVVAGVAILRQLVKTSPDLPTAIASYYQGQAGVRKYGMYPDTRRYVANVQTLMARYA